MARIERLPSGGSDCRLLSRSRRYVRGRDNTVRMRRGERSLMKARIVVLAAGLAAAVSLLVRGYRERCPTGQVLGVRQARRRDQGAGHLVEPAVGLERPRSAIRTRAPASSRSGTRASATSGRRGDAGPPAAGAPRAQQARPDRPAAPAPPERRASIGQKTAEDGPDRPDRPDRPDHAVPQHQYGHQQSPRAAPSRRRSTAPTPASRSSAAARTWAVPVLRRCRPRSPTTATPGGARGVQLAGNANLTVEVRVNCVQV